MSSITKKVIKEAVDSSFNSDPLNLQGQYHLSFQMVWTDTLSGSIEFEYSNDGLTWTPATPTGSPAGSPGSSFAEEDTAYSLVRVVYTHTSGSGDLKILVHGK